MKKKKRIYKQSDDYLNKLNEWQEHQYDPGYYTGGNLPPILTHPGNPKLLGWFWIITSIVCAIALAPFFILGFDIEQILPISVLAIGGYGIFILQFIGGIRYIKKSSTEEQYKSFKKLMLKILCYTITAIVIIILLNSTLLKRKSMIVLDAKSIEYPRSNTPYTIVINNGGLKLKCNQIQFSNILESGWYGQNSKLRLEYQWNILNPKSGKIIEVESVE